MIEGGLSCENNELDVNQFLIRTDLAVETKQAVKDGQAGQTKEINGFIEKNATRAALKSEPSILPKKAPSYREKAGALCHDRGSRGSGTRL